MDRPPVHKSHPQTTPPEVVRKILDLAIGYPAHGCHRLSGLLQLTGVSVSGVTIQKILDKHGMGTRHERLLKLEEKIAGTQVNPTPEQIETIEKGNPCFRERHVESRAPGELLCQDTFYIGTFKQLGKLYLQAVVDSYGSFAFGLLHAGKSCKHAVAILHNTVLPYYRGWGLEVKAIRTHNGGTYCGSFTHPYELYLNLHQIVHRKTKVRCPQTHGFVERFHRTVMDEFFRTACRPNGYLQVAALQEDLNQWLERYNFKRPHHGYRNFGKRPIDTVMPFRKGVWDLLGVKAPFSILPFEILMEILDRARRDRQCSGYRQVQRNLQQ